MVGGVEKVVQPELYAQQGGVVYRTLVLYRVTENRVPSPLPERAARDSHPDARNHASTMCNDIFMTEVYVATHANHD